MEANRKKRGREFWAGHLGQWEASGTSRRQYCIGEGISYWTFREWQKRLGQSCRSGNDLVQLPREIVNPGGKAEPAIELSLPGNITIRITNGFDGELLRAVLHELGVRS